MSPTDIFNWTKFIVHKGWKHNFLPINRLTGIYWSNFCEYPRFPSPGVVETLKEMGSHLASCILTHYHVLIACSMERHFMWVHWSTKAHVISPSKRCLAMPHKAHLICITLALWCGIAYYTNSSNLSNNFGSDLLHYQHRSSRSSTGAHLHFSPPSLHEKLQQQID